MGTITFLTGIIIIASIITWLLFCEKNNSANGLFAVSDKMIKPASFNNYNHSHLNNKKNFNHSLKKSSFNKTTFNNNHSSNKLYSKFSKSSSFSL